MCYPQNIFTGIIFSRQSLQRVLNQTQCPGLKIQGLWGLQLILEIRLESTKKVNTFVPELSITSQKLNVRLPQSTDIQGRVKKMQADIQFCDKMFKMWVTWWFNDGLMVLGSNPSLNQKPQYVDVSSSPCVYMGFVKELLISPEVRKHAYLGWLEMCESEWWVYSVMEWWPVWDLVFLAFALCVL